MKTYKYRDAFGHVYEVPEDLVREFERRRGILLRIAIVGQAILLAVILYYANFIAR